MQKCEGCGKSAGLWASITGLSHAKCETISAFRQIARGEFKSFDDEAEMILEHGEHCLAIVKRCEMADLYPQLGDNEGLVEAASAIPGVRPDGLVKQDAGSLQVTDRRIFFMGTFKARTIPLSDVVEVQHSKDALMILAGDRRSASYFILDSSLRVELIAAAIKKLAELAQSNPKPAVHLEPERTYLGRPLARPVILEEV